jgi:hypothetical protein
MSPKVRLGPHLALLGVMEPLEGGSYKEVLRSLGVCPLGELWDPSFFISSVCFLAHGASSFVLPHDPAIMCHPCQRPKATGSPSVGLEPTEQ